jgi:hypothetical protein
MFATVFGPADELTAVFYVIAVVLYVWPPSQPVPSAGGPAEPSALWR